MAALQWKTTDPVTIMPGIGPIKAKKLHDAGLFKLEDVLAANANTTVPGMNLKVFQDLIKQHTTAPPPVVPVETARAPDAKTLEAHASTEAHSWFHKVGHLLVHGTLVRVHVLEFVYLESLGFVLHVTWFSAGVWKHRSASPLYLSVLQHAWERNTVVSDDSDDEIEKLQVAPSYMSIEPFLGKFELTSDTAFEEALKAHVPKDSLRFCMKELNDYDRITLCR